jgi:cell division inhibitor SepF
MSVMRKAMVYLGLVDDEEFYADDDAYYADDAAPYEEERAPARSRREHAVVAAPAATQEAGGPVTVIRTPRRDEAPAPARATSMVKPVPMPATRVHVMEPKGFNDAQEVGDRLKAGQPVILNLQAVDRDLQRRLIDFSSGLAYALNGTMSKAAEQVFLLTPSNVEVSEEEKERLQARGLYRAGRS